MNLLDGLPRRHFSAALIDPPWKFKSYTGRDRCKNPELVRSVERHYQTMSMADIHALPVKDHVLHHVFLWTTGPMMPFAFQTLTAWGFKFSTVAFTWAKLKRSHDPLQLRVLPTAAGDFHVGLGLTTRKNCEFVLLGRRPGAKRLHKDVRELIVSPVREHSRKPDEIYSRIERYCEGPFLELFARTERPGWTCRGDEVGKFGTGLSP